MLVQFMEIKGWLKNIQVGMVKNGCGHLGLRALKLVVSQAVYGITGFWCVDTNSGKLKVSLIILGCDGQKWMWPFRSWGCKICCISRMKWRNELISCLLVQIYMGMVKNGGDLIDHGTLKPGVSHKWLEKLSRLIEWFLLADSDRITTLLISGGNRQLWSYLLTRKCPPSQHLPAQS